MHLQAGTNPEIESLVKRTKKKEVMANLERLVGFGTRHTYSDTDSETRGIGAARRWIHEQFSSIAEEAKANCEVSYERFDVEGRGGSTDDGRNVFLTQRGSSRPEEVVVVGAHYDALNLSAVRDGNVNADAPGANDNGSGTAAILELARVLTQTQFDRTIMYVAFAGEEQGLHGARSFVRFLEDLDVEVVAMVNNDTIGASVDEDGKKAKNRCRLYAKDPHDGGSRRLARWTKFLAEQYLDGFSVEIRNRQDRPGRGGDQMPFQDAGIDAVRLIEGLENTDVQHTKQDSLDRIDGDYLHRMTSLNVAVVAHLAFAPAFPENIKAKKENGQLEVNWAPVEGATSYRVAIRSGSANDLLIKSTQKSNVHLPLGDLSGSGPHHISVLSVEKNKYSRFTPEVTVELP